MFGHLAMEVQKETRVVVTDMPPAFSLCPLGVHQSPVLSPGMAKNVHPQWLLPTPVELILIKKLPLPTSKTSVQRVIQGHPV